VEVVAEQKFYFRESNLILLPQKALFFEDYRMLLIADLHLGKVNHFRRSGIAVPTSINKKNLELLIELIQQLNPKRVVFLGDLFHSHYNDEWEALGQVVRHFNACKFELVRGNHDIMSALQYERCHLQVHEQLELGSFLLTHEPMDVIPKGRYNIYGHIHPGVRLLGKGRQSITLPCFYFGQKEAIMPAFGSFTGYARIPVKKKDKVFIIADQKVIEMDQA
jgi:DNA ligase-associated metallophosphoesterase